MSNPNFFPRSHSQSQSHSHPPNVSTSKSSKSAADKKSRSRSSSDSSDEGSTEENDENGNSSKSDDSDSNSGSDSNSDNSDSASDSDSDSDSSAGRVKSKNSRKRKAAASKSKKKKKSKKEKPATEETEESRSRDLSSSKATPAQKQKSSNAVTTARFSKGLRHFSVMVCEKLAAQGTSTYNEIADQLVAENRAEVESESGAQFDEKNIRRRIYDALNVLMAMDILQKEKKSIRWKGIKFGQPTPERQSEDRLARQRIRNQEKRDVITELTLQYIATRVLLEKNKRKSGEQEKLAFPFVLVNTKHTTEIECQMDASRTAVKFDFSDCFCLHDERVLLQAIALNTPQYRSLIPVEIRPFVPEATNNSVNPTLRSSETEFHSLASNIQSHYSSKPATFQFFSAPIQSVEESNTNAFFQLYQQSHSPTQPPHQSPPNHNHSLFFPFAQSPSASPNPFMRMTGLSPAPSPMPGRSNSSPAFTPSIMNNSQTGPGSVSNNGGSINSSANISAPQSARGLFGGVIPTLNNSSLALKNRSSSGSGLPPPSSIRALHHSSSNSLSAPQNSNSPQINSTSLSPAISSSSGFSSRVPDLVLPNSSSISLKPSLSSAFLSGPLSTKSPPPSQ